MKTLKPNSSNRRPGRCRGRRSCARCGCAARSDELHPAVAEFLQALRVQAVGAIACSSCALPSPSRTAQHLVGATREGDGLVDDGLLALPELPSNSRSRLRPTRHGAIRLHLHGCRCQGRRFSLERNAAHHACPPSGHQDRCHEHLFSQICQRFLMESEDPNRGGAAMSLMSSIKRALHARRSSMDVLHELGSLPDIDISIEPLLQRDRPWSISASKRRSLPSPGDDHGSLRCSRRPRNMRTRAMHRIPVAFCSVFSGTRA